MGLPTPPRGLDRAELVLFVFGVLPFALLIVAFGQQLAPDLYLPLVVAWIVGGLLFIWWFHRHLAGRGPGAANQDKVRQIGSARRRVRH
jgi:hypothetical protein